MSKNAYCSPQIYTDGRFVDGAVLVEAGVIVAVVGRDAIPADYKTLVHDGAILPGLIDTHVHINEPGRTAWEGFETATQAAAIGGITTVIDMPLNSSPVTTDLPALAAKKRAAQGKLWIDVGLYAGAVAGNAAVLPDLLAAGCIAAKCFMINSGINEFAWVGEADLRDALAALSGTGVPLLAHAEVDNAPVTPYSSSYSDYVLSRPGTMEIAAVKLLIDLCREMQTPIHIVHVSAAAVLPLIAAAKAEGLPISAETCPHYLYFAAEHIPDGATQFKCAPPIRHAANREQLWQGLRDGVLDWVASDHSPCPPDLKAIETGDFSKAWGGIASLQFAPAVTWTGMRERGIGLDKLAEWWSAVPARTLGLTRKGRIAPGMDADLVLWKPDALADTARIYHRHSLTPYAGARLFGRAAVTIVGGSIVQSDGQFSPLPTGKLLLQTRTTINR